MFDIVRYKYELTARFYKDLQTINTKPKKGHPYFIRNFLICAIKKFGINALIKFGKAYRNEKRIPKSFITFFFTRNPFHRF